jgi:V8-like Glu-specific endopeptidase
MTAQLEGNRFGSLGSTRGMLLLLCLVPAMLGAQDPPAQPEGGDAAPAAEGKQLPPVAPEIVPDLPAPQFTVYGSSLKDNKIITGTLVPVNDSANNYGIAIAQAAGGGTITVPKAKDQVEDLKEPLSLYFGLAPVRSTSSRYNRTLTSDIEFGPVGVWRRARQKFAGNIPALDPVDKASNSLSEVALKVISTEPGNQPVRDFFNAIIDTKDAIDAAMALEIPLEAKAQLLCYRDLIDSDLIAYVARLRANPVTREPANTDMEETRILEKDFYRTSDNYRPEVNKMAINSSEATVAIVSAVGRDVKVGTGFVVGRRTVLTCWHVVKSGRTSDFEDRSYNVRFFDDHRPRGWLDPKATVDVGCKLICHNEELDYCLLELAENPLTDTARILPLSSLPQDYQTPVIVIGYPQGGNLTVHENSWIVFPSRLDQKNRTRLEARLVRDKIASIAPSLTAPNDGRISERYQNAITEVQNQIDKHYKKRVDDPNHLYTHEYQGEHYVGIESDTFRGNSGSPVINRERGQVIAMLRKGVEIGSHVASTGEAEFRRIVSSDFHERAVPMGVIIKDIKEKMGTNWPTEKGFRFEN